MKVICLVSLSYCLSFTAGASHLRARVRNGRKDLVSVSMCIDTTRRNGPQTCIVEGREEEIGRVIQLLGDSATFGACDPDNHRLAPLNKKQKKMVEVCLLSEGERISARLPRVARRQFKKLGAVKGSCVSPDSQIEIKLTGDDVEDAYAALYGQWRVEQIRLGASLKPPLEDSPIVIKFDESRISGTAGCNRIFGGFSIKSESDESHNTLQLVEIPVLASTKMACHPWAVMKQEYAFIKAITRKPFSYKMKSGSRLEFFDTEYSDGKMTEGELFAVFERVGNNL